MSRASGEARASAKACHLENIVTCYLSPGGLLHTGPKDSYSCPPSQASTEDCETGEEAWMAYLNQGWMTDNANALDPMAPHVTSSTRE